MRKLAGLTLLIAASSMVCMAQETPAVEVSAGYSYFRIGGSGGTNQNGASGSLAFNLNQWVGVVGDFGFYHSSPAGVSLNTETYMFGPRFSYRSAAKATPFAQVLFGGGHASASVAGTTATSNPFAYSFGGGVDVPVTPSIALRPQVDYVGLRSGGSTSNCVRLSAAVVFHFGAR